MHSLATPAAHVCSAVQGRSAALVRAAATQPLRLFRSCAVQAAGTLGMPFTRDGFQHVEYFAKPGEIVLPKRIILVRHGQSLGNVDENAYVHIPDWRIPLTNVGRHQAYRAGRLIQEMIGEEPVYFYTSPYLRTKQTLSEIIRSFENNDIIGVREEPRLTEQQFGNFQNVANVRAAKQERGQYGRFYYRFAQGESGLDVYNRVTSFIATMFRDFANDDIKRSDLNVIMVTHGLTLRLFLMRWFQYTVSDFEASFNPPNAGFVVMERTGKHQKDYFELPQWSREVVGFPKEHTQGSLWQVLQNTTDMSHVPEQFQSFLEPKMLTEQELEAESRKLEERRTNHAHEEILS